MQVKTSRKVLHISQLVVDLDLNFRDKANVELSYDIPHMMEDIVRVGRILDPIHVEPLSPETAAKLLGEELKYKEYFRVLRGNRRTFGGQRLIAKPDIAADLKACLEKVEVVVYPALTETERLTMVADHGSQKPITRSEVVTAVWRFDRQMFSEIQIAQIMYFALARFTNNEKKLLEMPSGAKEREDFLRTWLHGTLGNFILAAAKMGTFVREQFLLTHKDEDKLLPKDTKIQMRTSRERIKQLSSAITADKAKDGKGWSVEGGGEKFNLLVEKFKKEDSGELAVEKKQRLTAADLEKRASSFQSVGIRNAFLIASGDQNDDLRKGLADADDRYAMLDRKEALLVQYGNAVKDPAIRDFIGFLLHTQDATAFEEGLKKMV